MSQNLQTAIALHQAGKLPEAELAYRAILTVQPRNADALSLLGLVLEGLGKLDEAVASIESAIALDPQAALFRLHHGNALAKAKKFPEAEQAFREAIRLMPGMAPAHYNLANALREQQKFVEAIDRCKTALRLDPGMPMARNDLGLLLAGQKKFDEALQELDILCAREPEFFLGHLSRVQTLDQAEQYDRMLREAEILAKRWPEEQMAQFVYGLALGRHYRDAEALAVYKAMLDKDENLPEAWDNYAQSLAGVGRFEESFAAYERALRADSTQPLIQFHNAIAYLLRGNLKEGFSRYHWRFPAIKIPRPDNKAPHWQGEDIRGKYLMVYDEQGFGDCIMAMRYLPLLAQQGVRVTYACRDAFIPWLQHWRSSGLDAVVSWSLAKDVRCDYQAPIMDLPHRFGTTLDTVPQNIPYVPVPPLTSATTLAPVNKIKVGFVWKGNKNYAHDRRRSIPLAQVASLFNIPGKQFYSLVRSVDLLDEEKVLLQQHGVVDLGGAINSFADTAALVSQMDLVVSVDTSTIHMAGALGVPVYVMLRFNTDWRWFLNRDDSVWYPTARLFRQSVKRDWGEVIGAVSQAVIDFKKK